MRRTDHGEAQRRRTLRAAGHADHRRRGRRDGRDRRRRAVPQSRHRDVHDLRAVGTGRWYLVGQPVSRCGGRRRLVHLLVPVQAPRLDAHPRPPGRDPRLPRGDGQPVRPRSPSPTGNRRPARGVGRRSPRLPAHAHDRRGDRMPRARVSGGLPQRAVLPRLARPGGLRRPVLPHLAVGAPPRPHRQDRRHRRNRIDRVATRPRAPADRGQDPPLPARAGLGAAEGRP